MAKIFITTTFSPSMMRGDSVVVVQEVDEAVFWAEMFNVNTTNNEIVPAIGHKNTANIIRRRMPDFISKAMPENIFNRVKIEMGDGDWVFAIIPQFRPDETREFTDEEVKKAKFRFFTIA